METTWWENAALGDFGRFSLSGPLTPSNHNENLFRTYELLMLADIHVGFRPFLKNIFSTEVRSRGHFSSPSEAIPYQYTEGLKCYSKNRSSPRNSKGLMVWLTVTGNFDVKQWKAHQKCVFFFAFSACVSYSTLHNICTKMCEIRLHEQFWEIVCGWSRIMKYMLLNMKNHPKPSQMYLGLIWNDLKKSHKKNQFQKEHFEAYCKWSVWIWMSPSI